MVDVLHPSSQVTAAKSCKFSNDFDVVHPIIQPLFTDTLYGASLESMDKICYLGDLLDAAGGAESSSITQVNCS